MPALGFSTAPLKPARCPTRRSSGPALNCHFKRHHFVQSAVSPSVTAGRPLSSSVGHRLTAQNQRRGCGVKDKFCSYWPGHFHRSGGFVKLIKMSGSSLSARRAFVKALQGGSSIPRSSAFRVKSGAGVRVFNGPSPVGSVRRCAFQLHRANRVAMPNKRFNLRSLRSPDWAEKAGPAGLTWALGYAIAGAVHLWTARRYR